MTRKKAEEYIEKNASELGPILASFYGEKTEHYLKNIKKQNQLFCDQIISLMMEYKPNIIHTLTGTLETMHGAYINTFYEASQTHLSLTKELQNSSHSLDHIDQEIKQAILMMAKLCHQEIDESTLDDIYAAKNFVVDFKEKIETAFIENKTLTEESSQYLDLIEQLRIEKKDMRETISQALQVLEQIYHTYQSELKLPENIALKQFDYDALVATFKLSKP